jgi:uncharacterized integral membrane protein (TIGR00698 family)
MLSQFINFSEVGESRMSANPSIIDVPSLTPSVAPIPSESKTRGARVAGSIVFGLCVIACLTGFVQPQWALTAGILLALTLHNPFMKMTRPASKWLLQASVVLLGFRMDIKPVLIAGREGMIFAVLTIGTAFLLGWLVAKWLKIDRTVSTLISAGTAICGGSAVAAVGCVTGAAEGEMSVAMGTVFLLNAVALYAFPIIGRAMHMNPHQFGTWAGIAIHDVSSVVGAATSYSVTEALPVATTVKLARALWIVPVALLVGMVYHRRPTAVGNSDFGFEPDCRKTNSKPRLQLPWFIGLFLLASIARSYLPAISHVAGPIQTAATIGFTLTLFLIGAGLSRKTLKAVGIRPLLQGVILWLFLASVSAVAVKYWAAI